MVLPPTAGPDRRNRPPRPGRPPRTPSGSGRAGRYPRTIRRLQAIGVLAGVTLVAVALFPLATPVWAVTSTTSTPTTTPASTTTGPVTSSTSSSTSTSSSSTSSSSTVPVTVPPAGTPVNNLQLDAITAQFVADVEAEVGAAQDGLDLAQAELAKAEATQATATATLAGDTRRLDGLDAAQRQAAGAVQAARARLRDLAVAAYVSGGPGAPIEQLLSSGDINQFARRQGYLTTVAAESTDAIHVYSQARDASSRATLTTVDDLQRAQAAKLTSDLEVQSAQAAVADQTTVLTDRQALLTLTSDAVSTPHTDIPRMVLDAYQRAAVAVQAKGCHLAWWGLAGIGKIESDHGRDQHAHLAPNGDLLPRIVGVPLTGSNGTALIVDPGGTIAHAEGPMQFIPSTWLVWGRDGNGDGIKDIDNVYDAALGAANYLCATSVQLETDVGLQAAYFSYNHSTDYATEVLAYAKSYQAADAAGLIPPMSPLPLWSLAPPPPPAVSAGPGGTAGASTTTLADGSTLPSASSTTP